MKPNKHGQELESTSRKQINLKKVQSAGFELIYI
jgi:hypothetical protein